MSKRRGIAPTVSAPLSNEEASSLDAIGEFWAWATSQRAAWRQAVADGEKYRARAIAGLRATDEADVLHPPAFWEAWTDAAQQALRCFERELVELSNKGNVATLARFRARWGYGAFGFSTRDEHRREAIVIAVERLIQYIRLDPRGAQLASHWDPMASFGSPPRLLYEAAASIDHVFWTDIGAFKGVRLIRSQLIKALDPTARKQALEDAKDEGEVGSTSSGVVYEAEVVVANILSIHHQQVAAARREHKNARLSRLAVAT